MSHIYLDRDPRPSRVRPLAADIFLSFWHKLLGFPIENLRTLFFDTVEEDSMREMQPLIYLLLRKDPLQSVSLRRRSSDEDKQEAFTLAYQRTKFGRCARTMETQNQEMIDNGIQVSRFEFCVQSPTPSQPEIKYNFVVTFGVDPRAQDQNISRHRGRHRRR